MKVRKITPLRLYTIFAIIVSITALLILSFRHKLVLDPLGTPAAPSAYWPVQSIDTMKYSRDAAREGANNPEFDILIDNQVREIAKTGATHVAIGTPYDAEFIPYMSKWIEAARKYKLKVWFRGNMAGWEGWFEYPRIDRTVHTQSVKDFILENPTLFEDGDIFVSCPECENGGPGDPRMTQDTEGYRSFIINEYKVVKQAFKDINKSVIANYYSTNGDVARLIMDKETTKQLDGIIAVDHYVKSPQQLVEDIDDYARQSGGKVVLGEWGAPIPDIHGEMTPEEQADYLEETFDLLKDNENIEAINYWVSRGGSTELWSDDATPKAGVAVLRKYFKPRMITGKIVDINGNGIGDMTIMTQKRHVKSDKDGLFAIPVIEDYEISIMKDDYSQRVVTLKEADTDLGHVEMQLVNEDFVDKLKLFFRSLLP
ncbi:MAG: hypothetical protein ACEQSA_02105 [Weeksellaceae bacterium]